MGISVRKLKLVICNDLEKEKINEMYQFIRDAQYQQYRALNYAYGILLSGYQAGNMDLKSEEYKKAYDSLNAQNPLMQLPFGTGLSSRGLTRQKVTKDFKSDIKNGLAKVIIGLAKGKKLYDKREDLKKSDQLRYIEKSSK